MRRWIDLFEYTIPPTDYGYWVTNTGEIIPVDNMNHWRVCRDMGKSYNDVMDEGWIRIVIKRLRNESELSLNFEANRSPYKTISATKQIIQSDDYDKIVLEITTNNRRDWLVNRYADNVADACRTVTTYAKINRDQ